MTVSLERRHFVWIAALLSLVARVSSAHAADWYIDPATGSDSGDGTHEHPWQTLEAVVRANLIGSTIQAGDTVWLRSGKHGALTAKGGTFNPALTIAAEAGQAPQLSAASFSQAKGWVLRGVTISASFGTKTAGTLLTIDKASSDIAVRDCKLFSVEDASSWTADQWINTASSGISVSGTNVVISHNQLSNVRFGISVDGPSAHIEYNSVVNFSADGLRGLGDNGVFEYNVVKNVYVSQEDGDDNHDDGFQSWSTGPNGPGSGVVKGVVLRGNTIINREDPNQKLTNSLQGIGCFDGFFDDWVVENNVVATDHWHGISLYGMRRGRIVNNTVVDVNAVDPGPPWIMVNAHKDGTKSSGVLIRNNLATDYSLDGDGLTQDHNTELKDLTLYFVDPAKFDLHLKPGAPAIDQGAAEQTPELDAERIARPQGAGVDLGAYEWHEADVKPESSDAGQDFVPPSAAGRGGSGMPSAGAGGRAGANAGAGGRSSAGRGGVTGAGAGGSSRADAGPSADGGDSPHDDSQVTCGCRLSNRRASTPGALSVLAAFAIILRRRARRG